MLNIFRKYDIRGMYPEEINEEVAYEVGKALGTFFGIGKTIVVARDGRVSSESLKFNLIKGLVEVGMNVIDVDLVTTPTFHFLVKYFGADGGAIITASHNPPEYNGIKICDGNLLPIGYGNGLEKIEKIISEKKYVHSPTKGNVKSIEKAYIPHLDFLKKFLNKNDNPIRIVADLGNGSACTFFPELVKNVDGIEVILINSEVDGTFPNRDPEPKEENLTDLKNEILNTGADFGVAFDGDADRIVFVDNKGRVLPGDWSLSVFVKYLLKDSTNKKVVADITCTKRVKELVEINGGKLIESIVGRRFIVENMMKNDCFIGGEVSSHFYFKETNYVDDSFMAFIKMLGIISSTGKKLADIIDEIGFPIKKMFKIFVDENRKESVINAVRSRFASFKHDTMDGIRVFVDENSWFVVRPSNTEPAIKIVIESNSEEKINEIEAMIKSTISSH